MYPFFNLMTTWRSSWVSLRGRMTPSKWLPASFSTWTSLHTRTPQRSSAARAWPLYPFNASAGVLIALRVRDDRPACRPPPSAFDFSPDGARDLERRNLAAKLAHRKPHREPEQPIRAGRVAPGARGGDGLGDAPPPVVRRAAKLEGGHNRLHGGTRRGGHRADNLGPRLPEDRARRRRVEQLAPALVGHGVDRDAVAAQALQLFAEQHAGLLDPFVALRRSTLSTRRAPPRRIRKCVVEVGTPAAA